MRCVVASSPVSSAHVPRFLPEVSSGGSKSINSIRSSFGCLLLLCIVRIPTSVAAAPIAADDGLTAEQTEFFESKIRPVLAAHCYECHSGEAATKKATGINYPKGLEFWAFKPPVRVPLPSVVNSAWARNEIDHFVLCELEKQGLKPAMEADRRTLIRRLYFDLVGLPPEPEAVETFVNDTSSDAYEKVIDSLLAPPHYGERWGRHWLDLARFAEDQAHTFQARMYPQGYLYRDWGCSARESVR